MYGYKYKGGGEFPDIPEYTGDETRDTLEVRGGVVFCVTRNIHTGAEVRATKHPNQGWAECRQVLAAFREAELQRLTEEAEPLLTKEQAFLSDLRLLERNAGSPLVFRVTTVNGVTYLEKRFCDTNSWDSWGSYQEPQAFERDIALIKQYGARIV